MRVQVLTDDLALRETFKQLCSRYQRLEAAVAWCGSPVDEIPYSLMGQIARRARMTIGTKFCHTHPDGLAMLRDMGADVRIVEDEEGVFHPKVYLFSRPGRKALLLGSANLTRDAFSSNQEALMLLEGTTAEMRNNVLSTRRALKGWQEQARELGDDWLEDYRERYRKENKVFRGNHAGKSPIVSDNAEVVPLRSICRDGWQEYYRRVSRRLREHEGDHWKLVLEAAHRLIPRNLTPAMLARQQIRSLLLGIPSRNDTTQSLPYFGHVGASGKARHLLAKGTVHQKAVIVSSFNAARRMGTDVNYDSLLRILRRLCALGPTMKVWGRFLVLANPACYLSVSDKSLRGHLSRQLVITQNRLVEPEGYVAAVRLLHKAPWYKSPKPSKSRDERWIWQNRVAYIDPIYYDA